MKLVPYTNEDSTDLLKMMEKHIDFTPEIETPENEIANYDYVHEMCIENQIGALSYLLKSADETILGYISACSREGGQYLMHVRITALFVQENDDSVFLAGIMLERFMRQLCDAKDICVHINPNVKKAADFWSGSGFIQAPELSLFINEANWHLMAYWKPIFQGC